MSFTNRELHGIDAPLEKEILLKAGPFTAVFEPSRAYLRRVAINGVESVRVVYLHARKPDWGTIVPAVTMIHQDIGKDHFELTWKAVHREGEIDFEWIGTLKGDPTGIYYVADGEAKRAFKTNRTGMCVLIPREFKGLDADVQHPDGSHSKVELPKLIAPVEPLRDMQSVSVGPVKLTFEGDVFEAEDQRNWTDASFKCYSLRGRRKPAYSLEKGEKIRHAVRIEHVGSGVASPHPIILGERPKVGATISNDKDDLSGLTVDFLRVELSGKQEVDRHILDHARSAGLPLQVVVAKGVAIPNLHANETLIAVEAAKRPDGKSPTWLGAGSFDSFNVGRREAKGFDGIEVSVTPQIHTFDERSILENAETLADVVATLQSIAPGAAVGLNVHMKGDGPDPRLQSLFGALWVLQCFKVLCSTQNVHLTLGSVVDLRYPPVAAVLKELSGVQSHRLGIGSEDHAIITVTGNSELIGNLLRKPHATSDVAATGEIVEYLGPLGWRRGGPRRITLTPYEIFRVSGPGITGP